MSLTSYRAAPSRVRNSVRNSLLLVPPSLVPAFAGMTPPASEAGASTGIWVGWQISSGAALVRQGAGDVSARNRALVAQYRKREQALCDVRAPLEPAPQQRRRAQIEHDEICFLAGR